MTLRALFSSTAILLIDGIGAALTALGVGVVLPALQPWFGLPVVVLRGLGGVALGFAIFSLGRHFSKTASAASVRHIAMANLAYCVVTAALLVVYSSHVTVLACVYFIGEMLIVVALSWRELSVARRLTSGEHAPRVDGERPAG